MKTFTNILMFTIVSTSAMAQSSNLSNWLEECMKIRCDPAISTPLLDTDKQTAQYTEAAAKGNIVTSLMLEKGAKLAGKNTDAAKWAKTSQDNKVEAILAEQAANDARAQTFLFDIYSNGLAGIKADNAKAVENIRKAADQGFALAQNILGGLYQWGSFGIERDREQAVAWYRKAADQGLALGQTNLAVMYGNGSGVTKDDGQAEAWYRKAADQGFAYAKDAITMIEAAKNPIARPVESSNTASNGVLVNDRNQNVGQITPTGEVRNERNQKIGQINSDGEIRNDRNQNIGKIMPDGEVRNDRNQKIGSVSSDGEVRNDRNQNIGKIMPDGEVRNDRNQRIGRAQGIKKEWAAVFFFFSFFKSN
jgi:hypothetical protein